jgi:hypothetical protein
MLGVQNVKIINRVRDEKGKHVPYDAHIAGECVTIEKEIWLPVGYARVVVHGSMYSMDPVTNQGQYRLGVEEWGMDVSPIPVSEVQRLELIEREQLTPDRQIGSKNKDGKTLKPVRLNNPIRRHDPIGQNMPGPRQDGAHPGGYGDIN